MAKEIVNRGINIYIQSGDAQKAFDVLIAKTKVFEDELKTATNPKRIAVLKDEINKLKEPTERAGKKLRGELLPTLSDLERATKRWLNEFKKTGDPAALAQFKKFQNELNVAKTQIKNLDDAQQSLSKKGMFSAAFWANLAAGAITAVTSQLSSFFITSVEEALEADLATRKLQSTLDNLGRTDAFDRLTIKAQRVADKFRFLDNDDVVAVFNKLIDYGKLTEKQMDQLLPVIINFAVKSGITIEESTSVILKALEGNGKALKEYGINIKDAGTDAERLNVILTTLAEKTDGAAEAFQKSAKGGLATARQEFANLKEEIGNGLIPVLNTLLSWTNKLFTGLGYLGRQLQTVGDDVFAFVTKGPGGLADSKNARALATRNRIEQSVAEGIAQKETAETVQKMLDDKFRAKAATQRLAERGSLSPATAAADIEDINTAVRVLGKSLQILAGSEGSEILGITPPGSNKNNGPSKIDQNAKDLAELLKTLQKIRAEQKLSLLPEFELELTRLNNRYHEFTVAAKGSTEALILIEKDYHFDYLELVKKFGREQVAEWQRTQKNVLQESLTAFEKNIKAVQSLSGIRGIDPEKRIAEFEAGRAKKKQEEDDAEEVSKMKLDFYVGYLQSVQSITSIFDNAKTEKENAELERDRLANEQKKRNLDGRLKAGTISQQQYDREIQKLEKEQDKRERAAALKQFKRQQRADIVQALINGALAVTSTLAAKPGPMDIATFGVLRAIQIGLAVATTAAQIATIASQKPPTLARGGELGGRSHSTGGNAVIDGQGRKIAEVEAGEGIINKHSMRDKGVYNVSGTLSQIASGINSLHGGVSWAPGARLQAGWMNSKPTPFNFGAIRKYYAEGGVFANGNTVSGNGFGGSMENTLLLVAQTLSEVRAQLRQPIKSYTVLSEHQIVADRLAAIKADATLK